MRRILFCLLLSAVAVSAAIVHGRVLDPQGQPVAGATVAFGGAKATSDDQGMFVVDAATGVCAVTIDAPGFVPVTAKVAVGSAPLELHFERLAPKIDSVVVSAKTLEPTIDLRNSEIFNRPLFTRDDQVFQQLDAGIDAGQHEGGGKSLEIRRFGFNLDHGGVNGGLKVLLDDVQQNQGTQGHGQGYLGSLKSVSPELIQDVTVINGPFSAEYGDFSGLGVVHIRQRESMPDVLTLRAEGGQFGTARGFAAYSPDLPGIDSYVAYEGSYTDGPFLNPLRYRRDNFNTNVTKHLHHDEAVGLRLLVARNDFYSSGQIPLDLVAEGLLNRFGYVDPSDGGRCGWRRHRGITAAHMPTATPFGRTGSFRARCSTCTRTSLFICSTRCAAMRFSSTIRGCRRAPIRGTRTCTSCSARVECWWWGRTFTTTRSTFRCIRGTGACRWA